MIKEAPIIFKPYLKTVIWGGNKICQYKEIPQLEPNIGESWEISAVPGHVSIVADGEYAGLSLTELIQKFGAELLGKKVMEKYGCNFPLLVKLIDANDNLSVQVHPNDNLANKRHNCLGKTEMWYIISSDENAKIFAGLNRQITPEEYELKVNDGSFTDVLATHSSSPGDVFFLPAGRVHAIGAGNLLAEIQENSDITYRIFDYNRRDASGNTRELHTDLAKDAIDYNVRNDYKSEAPNAELKDAELVNCSHFNVHRILINGTDELKFNPESFTVIMCLDGSLKIGDTSLSKGQTALLPAIMNKISVSGNATILTAQA